MDFEDKLKSRIKKVNDSLNEYSRQYDNLQGIIYEAMNYSLFAGGKRLRPVIMLSVCDMLGRDEDICLPFAAALEMIHTYSLIHDDLPAMDNDDLRRGMPTSHIKFGEATAILAGDALLTKAFEIVSSYVYNGICKKNVLRAANILAVSAGTEGMIGGQVIDLASEGTDIDAGTLMQMHRLKTGALIRAAARIGAVLAEADERQADAVDKFAENIGIAFQIRDDILDVEGNAESVGKSLGSDKKKHKSTFVTLYGLEESRVMVKRYSEDAVRALEVFGDKSWFLTELTEYLIERNS